MNKLSFEYCHIYPGQNVKKEIREANEWAPRVLKMFDDHKVQKCIMFDDIHASIPIDDKFIRSTVDQLVIKPDCIYLESEFIYEADKMVKAINPYERDFIRSGERLWLRENVEKYRTTTEFLLSWKNNKGSTEFSCPSLAATSYLTRLGYIKGDGVKTIYGDDLIIADKVLNLLSSRYVEVEDKAQSILEATYKESLRKVCWFFY